MQKALITLLVAYLILTACLISSAVVVIDAKLTTYEDGSGKVTFCIPLNLCK